MNMSNLEPDILLSQWCRWYRNNVSETLQTVSDGVMWASYFMLLCLPQDFAGTSLAACKLYRAGSKFHWPFRSLAACA